MSNKINRKAQVSETIVWIVATLIIIVVLIGAIFISSVLGKTKGVHFDNSKISLDSNANVLNTKTNFAYSLASEKNKKIIDDWRNNNEP